jgi:folate-binding protein YgfZ
MFQENNNLLTIAEYFAKKFPNSKKEGNSVRYFYSAHDEYKSLKNGIGIRIKLNSTIIEMTGKDVLDFLHRVSTNTIKDLKLFEKRNTLFLNEKGRFISRSTLLNLEDKFYLIGNSDYDKRLFSWVNKFIITEDIITRDVSENFIILELIGKQCNSFLTMLVGEEIDSVDTNLVRVSEIDGFKFHYYREHGFNSHNIYRILIDKEKCIDFLEYLSSIKSVFDLSVVGENAYDVFRIENCIPSYPNEINDSINPHEVNLINEISFKKGCYIGQEVIARLDTYDKVQRKLVRITINEPLNIITPLMIIDEAGNECGVLTTISSPKLVDPQIGLALIKKKVLSDHTVLFIKSADKKIRIRTSEIT